jgi:hypothetical protein
MIVPGMIPYFLFFLFFLAAALAPPLLAAEEKIVGEGEHKGLIVNEGEQILRVASIKPGQTLQAFISPEWRVEEGGRVEWVLSDLSGATLRTARHHQPEAETLLLEWTSNSEPRPNGYLIRIRGLEGNFPGEILGQYTVNLALWDQNDGNSGTDAPESFEKALELPVSEPGTYQFDECFLSSTADIYDIYRISLRPNHSLTLKAAPIQWKGTDKKAKVRWEFSNRFFKPMKAGQFAVSEVSSFVVKIFHPQVKSSNKPAIFYLLVKIEGEASLVYSLHVDTREGR